MAQYGIIPVTLELAVELSYPVAEGVTAVVTTFFSCLATVLFLVLLYIPRIGEFDVLRQCSLSCFFAFALLHVNCFHAFARSDMLGGISITLLVSKLAIVLSSSQVLPHSVMRQQCLLCAGQLCVPSQAGVVLIFNHPSCFLLVYCTQQA